MKEKVSASAPGRICLFGEHQDYLNLPVIAAAISLRINIEGRQTIDRSITLDLPDIDSVEEFELNGLMGYKKERDYFKSAYNVLLKKGFKFESGVGGTVRGNIPINSGTSSSSALIVAWIKFLSKFSTQGDSLSPEEIASLAFEAEVLEFNEPGGMMDMYSSAVGGVVFLDFHPSISVSRLTPKLGAFVLGDSNQPKDTTGILSKVKTPMQRIINILKVNNPVYNVRLTDPSEIAMFSGILRPEEQSLLKATVNNYQITLRAYELLKRSELDHKQIGELLSKHHQILRDDLEISTSKIDRMIDAALKAGAYGAKINGSGGGGCMFAYAPENPEAVAESIRSAGGQPYIINVGHGVQSN